MTSCRKLGTHKHKRNSTKFIQKYLLASLLHLHINEQIKSNVTNYVLDILV